jgi:O-acetyl-ADP-ribose deacetylase (regulator of RNase III)
MATFTNCDGSIFESQCEVLVNPVNCVRVMGKGLALEFKKRYPEMFEDYQHLCKPGGIEIGIVYIHNVKGRNRFIVSFPTKRHWKDSSKVPYIESGLENLALKLATSDVTSIAIPALGCGLGGLDWTDVEPLIREKLGAIDRLDVELYGPQW